MEYIKHINVNKINKFELNYKNWLLTLNYQSVRYNIVHNPIMNKRFYFLHMEKQQYAI